MDQSAIEFVESSHVLKRHYTVGVTNANDQRMEISTNSCTESKREATWLPHEKHGRLTKQSDLPDSVFAFPKQRKEPLTDASHVRNSIARFDQVIGVSDKDRELAFANIKKAAKHYGIDMNETDWTQLGRSPHKGA
jgi:hypothetical protein